jgi:uncharacterized protein (DUF58 family)
MPSQPHALFERASSPRLTRRSGDVKSARTLAYVSVPLAFLGLLFGIKSVFAFGCALLCLALLVLIWVNLGVRWIRVQRRMVERRVVEGELMEAVIEVKGRHALIFGVKIADPFTGAPLAIRGQGWMPTGNGTRKRQVVSTAGRRGRHSFEPPVVMLDDPLRLASAYGRVHGVADEVLILPRIEAVAWSSWGWQALRGERDSGQAIFGAGEVDGLREYQSGTPATRIHWPSLARGSGLLERRLVAAAETRPTVVLDARTQKTPEGLEQLDAAVRAAASLVIELARNGGCAVLLSDKRMPTVVGHNLQGWSTLHNQLALIEAEWYAGPAPAVRHDVVRGPLVYVSTGTVSLPSLSQMSPYAVVHVQPLSADHGEERPVFEVAGCGGYLVRQRKAHPSRRAAA